MPTAPLLQAENVGRKAAGGEWLIRHVSLSISAGERWAVAGPTGSGKTLLLRALALLDPIDEGELAWQGAGIAHEQVPHYRRQVVYLHQRPVLTEGTVAENLQLPFELAASNAAQFNRELAIHSLEQLGRPAAFLDKPGEDLSGGEAQIVALLRTMQVDPSLLLLDEPTSALDADTARSLERLVSNWLDESPRTRAVVWVTHSAEQRRRVAGNLLTLAGGEMARIG